ncbi:unnamed protein product [Bursaphelenchus okinawaensis]|uniref:G-protein coupled receptors family 1 profile domain-containing protein n=1 Tax=Bursaphelenchus okinawaensis TaxID=465554 RepID=A0A811KGF6_9BILA|nr:unnamed protein product [Bursaphelenchus okinawaensis]CAG9103960.1 unnamed protein product [Bursaphelenchus okinawaensis]
MAAIPSSLIEEFLMSNLSTNLYDMSNLTQDEARLHQILMKFRPKNEPSRLISVEWSVAIGIFFVVTTICGLMGNFTVILAIAADRGMRKSAMNLLLLNLAVADVCNLVTIILEWSPALVYGYPAWEFPAFLCPMTRYLECAFLFASILTQLIVCVERFIAIVFPIHARQFCTKQNVITMVCIVWFTAFSFSLPYALAHVKLSKSNKCTNMYEASTIWLLYKWFEFMTAYSIPCTVMVILYGKVACVLWAKNSMLHNTESRNVGDDRQRGEPLYIRRNVIKMLVACVLLYFICYSPIQGVFIAGAMFGPSSRPPYQVVLLLNALAVMCSACNPLLYTLFSRKFRTRMMFILTCGRHGAFNSRNEASYSVVKLNRNKSTGEPEKELGQFEMLLKETEGEKISFIPIDEPNNVADTTSVVPSATESINVVKRSRDHRTFIYTT